MQRFDFGEGHAEPPEDSKREAARKFLAAIMVQDLEPDHGGVEDATNAAAAACSPCGMHGSLCTSCFGGSTSCLGSRLTFDVDDGTFMKNTRC